MKVKLSYLLEYIHRVLKRQERKGRFLEILNECVEYWDESGNATIVGNNNEKCN